MQICEKMQKHNYTKLNANPFCIRTSLKLCQQQYVLVNPFKIKKGKLFFYSSYRLHLLANALCAGCHECALGVVPQVHLAVPMHLVHLVQDLLDGGRLSCPLDVHCIRKPVCDCRNLDVAVALSAPCAADMMQRYVSARIITTAPLQLARVLRVDQVVQRPSRAEHFTQVAAQRRLAGKAGKA